MFVSFQLKGDLTKSDNFKDGLALRTTYKVIIFCCVYIIPNAMQLKQIKFRACLQIALQSFFIFFIITLVLQAFSSHKGGHIDIPGHMFTEEQTFFIVYAQVMK